MIYPGTCAKCGRKWGEHLTEFALERTGSRGCRFKPLPREIEKPIQKKQQMNPELIKELDTIRDRLFDLANSQAGNDKGNAASYLHASANEITRAIKCLERGNPASDPIPFRFVAASMGIGIED